MSYTYYENGKIIVGSSIEGGQDTTIFLPNSAQPFIPCSLLYKYSYSIDFQYPYWRGSNAVNISVSGVYYTTTAVSGINNLQNEVLNGAQCYNMLRSIFKTSEKTIPVSIAVSYANNNSQPYWGQYATSAVWDFTGLTSATLTCKPIFNGAKSGTIKFSSSYTTIDLEEWGEVKLASNSGQITGRLQILELGSTRGTEASKSALDRTIYTDTKIIQKFTNGTIIENTLTESNSIFEYTIRLYGYGIGYFTSTLYSTVPPDTAVESTGCTKITKQENKLWTIKVSDNVSSGTDVLEKLFLLCNKLSISNPSNITNTFYGHGRINWMPYGTAGNYAPAETMAFYLSRTKEAIGKLFNYKITFVAARAKDYQKVLDTERYFSYTPNESNFSNVDITVRRV